MTWITITGVPRCSVYRRRTTSVGELGRYPLEWREFDDTFMEICLRMVNPD